MKMRPALSGVALAAAVIVLMYSCKDMGTEAPAPPPPPPVVNQLTAVPPSVTVGSGTTATVSISGGVRPYAISTAPSASLATAVLNDTTLTITGVTIASAAGSTSVRVVDGSPSPAKGVTVPVTKTYP
jgi:hypothetical protein